MQPSSISVKQKQSKVHLNVVPNLSSKMFVLDTLRHHMSRVVLPSNASLSK